ncbi:acylphosphatase [Specibacter cremeus]|uniref:acylphosphatase n=1 Tax=Specibacter cremeus TaxID=1629051 RepID=UPI000F78050C|nr:acylphosphatase [Specibacter cremeus]
MTEQAWAGSGNIRVRVRVTGVVQGVGFRYLAARAARVLGLAGVAANRGDGSVEIIAEGAGNAVAALLEWLQSADAPGLVNGVQATYSEPTGEFTGFGIG